MQIFSKKKTALAALLSLAIAQGVFAAPAAPTGLQAPEMAVSETAIPLVWQRADKKDKVIGYNVYMDGKLLVRTDQDFSTDAKKELKDLSEIPQSRKNFKSYVPRDGFEIRLYSYF
jgi:exo-poly-alpha-galacturonosidase